MTQVFEGTSYDRTFLTPNFTFHPSTPFALGSGATISIERTFHSTPLSRNSVLAQAAANQAAAAASAPAFVNNQQPVQPLQPSMQPVPEAPANPFGELRKAVFEPSKVDTASK